MTGPIKQFLGSEESDAIVIDHKKRKDASMINGHLGESVTRRDSARVKVDDLSHDDPFMSQPKGAITTRVASHNKDMRFYFSQQASKQPEESGVMSKRVSAAQLHSARINTCYAKSSDESHDLRTDIEEEKPIQIPKTTDSSFPLKPGRAIRTYSDKLTDYEKGEILDYKQIWFVGHECTDKINASKAHPYNCGFDDEKGDYQVRMKDHIGYRFEVIESVG